MSRQQAFVVMVREWLGEEVGDGDGAVGGGVRRAVVSGERRSGVVAPGGGEGAVGVGVAVERDPVAWLAARGVVGPLVGEAAASVRLDGETQSIDPLEEIA